MIGSSASSCFQRFAPSHSRSLVSASVIVGSEPDMISPISSASAWAPPCMRWPTRSSHSTTDIE